LPRRRCDLDSPVWRADRPYLAGGDGTGCLLMTDTRLNALMVTATQIAAEI
jgi:hypothetical protein